MDRAQNSSSARDLDLGDWHQDAGGSFGALDDLGTLQSGSPALASTESPGRRGRKRDAEAAEQETFESLLAQLGQDEDAELLENKRSAGSKPSATAARNKASRERQRRERLNDCFADLAKILEPGKASKTDKANIISDAIRIVTQLRGENNQLRQLNKFLEERVSQCEKARNDLLLQQALMQGQGRMVPGSSHMGPTMFPGQLPNVVQGVAIGLPAGMQMGDRAGSGQPGQEIPRPPSAMQHQLQHSHGLQPMTEQPGQQAEGQPQLQAQRPQLPHTQQQGTVQPQLPHTQQQGAVQTQQASLSDAGQGQPVQGQVARQPLQGLSQGLPVQGLSPGLHVQGLHSLQQQQGLGQGSPIPPEHVMSEAQAYFLKQELPESMGYGTAQGMLPGGMSSWLPPSTMDTSMDSIRRPPAA